MDMEELPLTYLPGNVTRFKARAVGALHSLTAEEATEVILETVPNVEFIATLGLALTTALWHLGLNVLQFALDSDNSFVAKEVEKDEIFDISPRCCEDGEDVWELTAGDVECITIGAGILGCGGGGNPHMGKLRVLNQIAKGKRPKVVSLKWYTCHFPKMDSHSVYALCRMLAQGLGENWAVPVGMLGAPLVLYERIPSGTETMDAAVILNEIMTNPEVFGIF